MAMASKGGGSTGGPAAIGRSLADVGKAEPFEIQSRYLSLEPLADLDAGRVDVTVMTSA
jgi:hypothetical protein